MLNIDCFMGTASDTATRCLPANFAQIISSSAYFGDAGCTVPVAEYAGCQAVGPDYVLQLSATCPTTYTVFAVGTAYASYYFKNGATCTAEAATATVTWYSWGAAITPSEFQSATHDVE